MKEPEPEPAPEPRPEPEQRPEPEFGKTIVADGEGVRYKAPGGAWQTLDAGAELPVGVALDARSGSVNLSSAGCRGGVQTGTFGGGVFSVRQPRSGCGRVDVYLRGGSFERCARPARRGGARRGVRARRRAGSGACGVATAAASYRSHGRHSHATVRGTRWLTEDRCDGTLTRVTEGAVRGARLQAPPQRAGSRRPLLPGEGRAGAHRR